MQCGKELAKLHEDCDVKDQIIEEFNDQIRIMKL